MKRVGVAACVLVFAIGPSPAVNTSPDGPMANATPGSSDWWAAARGEIARSEYRITWARTILPDLPGA